MNTANQYKRRKRAELAAFSMVVLCVILFMRKYMKKKSLPREPSRIRDLHRKAHVHRILYGGTMNCVDYVCMDTWNFFSLVDIMRDRNLLKDTLYVTVEEQLAMFLHTVGHHTKNRIVKIEFIRSGETISRYFSTVLRAICAIKNQFVQQAGPEIHPEIASSPLYFPYFKVIIKMLNF